MARRSSFSRLYAAALILCPAIPASAADWIPTALPGMDDVTILESTGNALFAGTSSGRIFRSLDDGDTWGQVWEGADVPVPVSDFLVRGPILLAASGFSMDLGLWDCFSPACGSPTTGGGILKSEDGGASWSLSGPPAVTALAWLPAGPDSILLAATLSGLFLSRDAGRSWAETTLVAVSGSPWSTEGARQSAIRDMETLGMEVVFTWRGGLHRIETAGGKLRTSLIRSGVRCLAPLDQRVLACGDSALLIGAPGNVWGTLAVVNLDGIAASGDRLTGWKAGQTGLDSMRVLVSGDQGRSWVPAAAMDRYWRMALSHAGGLFAANGILAVQRWDSVGSAWRHAAHGFAGKPVTSLALADGSVLAAVSAYRPYLFRRARGPAEAPWQELPWSALSVASRDGKAYVSDGILRVSPEGGAPGSWKDIGTAQGNLVLGAGWQLAVRADNTRDLCIEGSCSSISLNGLTPSFFTQFMTYLNGFSGAAVDGDTVLLALDSLYRSDNRGLDFRKVGAFPLYTTKLARSGGTLYAIGNPVWSSDPDWFSWPDLAQSEDGGGTWNWTDVRGIRGFKTINDLVVRNGELYAATDSGVFLRKPGQASWTDMSAGLPVSKVRSLAVEGGWLAAGLQEGQVMLLEIGPPSVTGRQAVPTANRSRQLRTGIPGRFTGPDGALHSSDGRVRK